MNKFWKNKKVLVTGATGFIGSWLTESLVENGSDVTILVNKSDPFKEDAIKHLKKKIHIIYGDIRNKNLISKAVNKCEIICHLAATTQVLYSIKNPEETLSINLWGTFNLLEGMRKSANKPFLIFVSTDKVYGEPIHLPIKEDHSLSAKSPYDASKVAADRLVYAYYTTYGINATILRWSNAYGGRDANMLRVIPDFVNAVINDKPLVIRGSGKNIRDFLYVGDVVRAILSAGENRKITNGEVFNLGTNKPISIEELARLVIKITGHDKAKPIILGKATPGEIDRQYLSFEKANKMLGWEPQVDLQTGLKITLDWYKNNSWWKKVMGRVSKFHGI
ncbi:MAG: SDR family NAD(P)-dependent oxidoreductase [Candidatus Paceibacterota bacterium]|jgi:dTDP-glucose 4,6-dehydratase